MRCCEMPIGLKLKGVVAWIGWIVLHLFYLLGGRNRVQTLINLGSRYRRPAPLQRDRRRRDGDAEAAGDECQGRTAGRCIASAPSPEPFDRLRTALVACALSLSKGGLEEACWHVGWPGPESNRRPFTFQANATTD